MPRPNLHNDKYFLKLVDKGIISVTKRGTIRHFNLKGQYKKVGYTNSKGYKSIGHKYNKKVKHILVHRLVYLVHGKYKLSQDIIVNHIDGIKSNNRLRNLEAVTYSENLQHAYKTGLTKVSKKTIKRLKQLSIKQRGENGIGAKLTNDQARAIRNIRNKFNTTQQVLANMFGVSRECIKDVLNYNTYKD